MNRAELNELIKEELEIFLEEEDMEPQEMEIGDEAHEELMDELKGFYDKLKAHFEGDGGEEKTEEEEEEMEDEEAEVPEEEGEPEEVEEIALNESVNRFKKLANIRG